MLFTFAPDGNRERQSHPARRAESDRSRGRMDARLDSDKSHGKIRWIISSQPVICWAENLLNLKP